MSAHAHVTTRLLLLLHSEGKSYTLVLEKVGAGNIAHYVPRCVGGKDGSKKVDLAKINVKLYDRRWVAGGWAGARRRCA
jgi:hypothetical protein